MFTAAYHMLMTETRCQLHSKPLAASAQVGFAFGVAFP
jgi:hypothetical protein